MRLIVGSVSSGVGRQCGGGCTDNLRDFSAGAQRSAMSCGGSVATGRYRVGLRPPRTVVGLPGRKWTPTTPLLPRCPAAPNRRGLLSERCEAAPANGHATRRADAAAARRAARSPGRRRQSEAVVRAGWVANCDTNLAAMCRERPVVRLGRGPRSLQGEHRRTRIVAFGRHGLISLRRRACSHEFPPQRRSWQTDSDKFREH